MEWRHSYEEHKDTHDFPEPISSLSQDYIKKVNADLMASPDQEERFLDDVKQKLIQAIDLGDHTALKDTLDAVFSHDHEDVNGLDNRTFFLIEKAVFSPEIQEKMIHALTDVITVTAEGITQGTSYSVENINNVLWVERHLKKTTPPNQRLFTAIKSLVNACVDTGFIFILYEIKYGYVSSLISQIEKTYREDKESAQRIEYSTMQHREHLAKSFCRIEERLFENPNIDLQKFIDTNNIILPTVAREKLSAIATSYQNKIEQAQKNYQQILLRVGTINPEVLGKEIFIEKVNSEPKGKIELSVVPGFIILIFEEQEDQTTFWGQNAGGMCSNTWGGEDSTLITTQKFMAEKVLRHERQHFINHTINIPFVEENHIAKRSNDEEWKLDRIKDELLAYLRDGSSPNYLETVLKTSPLYENIHLPMGMEILQEITQIFEEHPILTTVFFSTQKTRQLLVYSLIDVPLRSIPRMLRRIASYYGIKKSGSPLAKKRKITEIKKHNTAQKQYMIDAYEQGVDR